MVDAMPPAGEFVVLFEQGEIQNLQGERILSFGVTLFDKVHQVEFVDEPQHEDFDSALEAIEASPVRSTDSLNYIQEKH